jgi:hypothetical protein
VAPLTQVLHELFTDESGPADDDDFQAVAVAFVVGRICVHNGAIIRRALLSV